MPSKKSNAFFLGVLVYLVLAVVPPSLKALGLAFGACSWWWVALVLWLPWVATFGAWVVWALREAWAATRVEA